VKISVVTVAYNAAATIGDTLRSVAAQAGEVEHIVIDGGSTDGTAAVVAAHARPGTIFVSEPDGGLYDAMNKGAALATGDLIGFLNADDFFCRTDAARLVADAATAHGTAAISGGVAIVAARNPALLRRAYPATPFSRWMLRFAHMPPHPGFYVRRVAFDRVGPFDPSIRSGADFDWMLRFFLRERLTALPLKATLVTMRDGGVSNAGLGSRRRINAEALASLRRAGVASAAPLVWSKYMAKAAQLVAKAPGWPAPTGVRWVP
jgi:glycosyltransferase involved in cell wall biosynthesis